MARAHLAAGNACLRPAVRRALRRSLAYARNRYWQEQHGLAAHVALSRAASDRRLIHALRVHDLTAARAEADRLLVRHLVRLRVIRGARVLVDANPTSFSVAGPSRLLHGPRGRPLGTLTVTIQDVIGFEKLVLRHANAFAIVRGARGATRTLLPTVPPTLPRRGCTTVPGATYAVRSFTEHSFSGEALTIWVLVAA